MIIFGLHMVQSASLSLRIGLLCWKNRSHQIHILHEPKETIWAVRTEVKLS